MRPFSFFILLILTLPFVAVGKAHPFQVLKVLVGEEGPTSSISDEKLLVTDSLGRQFHSGVRVKFRACGTGFFTLNRDPAQIPGPLRVMSRSKVLRYKNSYFRGSLELRALDNHRIRIINYVDLETYLCGLVSSEMPASWPIEALKAQAVAARTYALWKINNSKKSYHLAATTHDQVYQGALAEGSNAVKAVLATRGWFMTHKGIPILAYYHSCCGGRTDSAREVKGITLPYLVGVACPWCASSPKFHWRLSLSKADLVSALSKSGYLVEAIDSIYPIKKTKSGRILELEIVTPQTTFFLTGEQFRKALGYRKFQSTRFRVTKKGNRFLFTGTGYGHGVGACQYGMKGMAEHGYKWRQILKHYYTGVEFRKIK